MRQVIRKSITDKWLLVDRASQRIKMDQIPYRLGNHASKQKKSSSSFLRCAVVQCTGCPNKCGLNYWSIPLTKFPKFSQSVSHFHGYLWEYQCKINKAMCATFKGIGNVKFCHTFMRMLNFCGDICHTFVGMSHFRGTLSWVCHTFVGMSHFSGYVTL